MNSNYARYDNQTENYDAGGNLVSIRLTVTLEGDTQWSGYPYTYHTGTVTASLAGQQDSNSTGPVLPNYYMDVSASVTLLSSDACFNSGNGCSADDVAEVDCDMAGLFFYDESGGIIPNVSISGHSTVPMLASGTVGPDSISLTATANPSGGSYSWTATSGAGNVAILNASSQTATIQSKAPGSSTIQVTYSYMGENGIASRSIRVQLPSRLVVTSDTGNVQDWECGNPPGSPYMCGVRRYLGYKVGEADGTGVNATMPIYESFDPVSSTCYDLPSTPTPSSGTTDGTGIFPGPDQLAMKSGYCLPADANGVPQGSCTLTVNQHWFANGYQVAYQQIQYACRTITLVPLQ